MILEIWKNNGAEEIGLGTLQCLLMQVDVF